MNAFEIALTIPLLAIGTVAAGVAVLMLAGMSVSDEELRNLPYKYDL